MGIHARPETSESAGLHDIGAEKIVLGAMMMSASAVAEVTAVVTAADYYRPSHQVIHATILALSHRGDPHDPVAVAHELKLRGELRILGGKGHLYLIECIEAVPHAANAGYYAYIVAAKASLRHVREIGTRLIQASEAPDPDLAELLDLARSQLDQISAAGPRAALEAALTELEPAAETVMPPVPICGDKLYRGAVHTLSGPPDCGKTTLACWWMLRAIRDGQTVLLLDEEGGTEIIAEKFQALGVKTGERLAYISFPGRSWNAADVAALAGIMDARRPTLVTWDSSAAFLARAGLDENAAADVTGFYSRVLVPCARQHGAAVLVIDHDTKSDEPSRYARGSGAKLAATDVAYKIEMVKAFSKQNDGSSRLIITKDRRGWLHRYNEVTFTAGEPLGVDIREVDAAPGEFRPTILMGKICDVLTRSPGLSGRQLYDRVRGNEKYFRQALALLVDEGYVTETPGPRGARFHEIAIPFND